MTKILTLGEIMLRLSTCNNERLSDNNCLLAHFGGAEANVAISLANFGHETYFASKIPDDALGFGAKQHLMKYGVNVNHLLFGGERLGTYYLETGAGIRSSSVIYDRKYSSFSQMTELEWDLDELFYGIDVLHVSGITPALSLKWQEFVLLLLKEAKKREITVSLDINYRGKLWSVSACRKYIQKIAPYIDWCSAGKLDAINFFEITETPNADITHYYKKIKDIYPNIKVFYSTTRKVISAQYNRLQGNLFIDEAFVRSDEIQLDSIVDRVGGGDAYAAGILHGLLSNLSPQETVEFATIAAALKHTIYGDSSSIKLDDIERTLTQRDRDVMR